MASFKKFLSFFSLLFIVILGATDAAGSGAPFSPGGPSIGSFACEQAVDSFCFSPSCTFLHERQEGLRFNEDIARIRRTAHYQHPKSNAPILLPSIKSWVRASSGPHPDAAPLREYNRYYSRASSDYYSFLFRLTPF